MKWAVYFRKYKPYNKMPLTKVFLLIILHFFHFLACSLFLYVMVFPWKRNFFFKLQPSDFSAGFIPFFFFK
jgi:hypothetical protein